MSIAPCVVAKAILARVRSKLVFWFYFETGNGVDAKKRPVELIDTEYYARDGVTRLENRLEQYLQRQYERRGAAGGAGAGAGAGGGGGQRADG